MVKKPKSKTESEKCLIVLEPQLFAKRDAKGEVTDPKTFSTTMFKEAQAKYLHVAVVVHAKLPESFLDPLEEIVEGDPMGTNASFLVLFDKPDPWSRIETFKRHMNELGASFKHLRNPREFHFATVQRFLLNPEEFVFATSLNDHDRIGIKLDKPKSFQELAAERTKKSFWA